MLVTFGRGTSNYQRENTLVPKKIWHYRPNFQGSRDEVVSGLGVEWIGFNNILAHAGIFHGYSLLKCQQSAIYQSDHDM